MTAADLDLLIVGGGVAGLSAAGRAAAAGPGLRVAVLTGAGPDRSATAWAQGGVAAVMDDTEVERGGVPRDVVATAVAAAGREAGLGHAWLDVSGVEDFEHRFPTLSASVRALGLTPGRDWLPVAPAARYLCGGVLTDLDGATTLPGLWAAGEVACTGVHGANRLASNSLLEGLVFATRAVDAIFGKKDGPDPTGALLAVLDPAAGAGGGAETLPSHPVAPVAEGGDGTRARFAIQRAMTDGARVVRDAASLASTAADLDLVTGCGDAADLLVVARAVVSAARARLESRGGHRRRDHPGTDPGLSRRFVQC